jgi:hypothetical protein
MTKDEIKIMKVIAVLEGGSFSAECPYGAGKEIHGKSTMRVFKLNNDTFVVQHLRYPFYFIPCKKHVNFYEGDYSKLYGTEEIKEL